MFHDKKTCHQAYVLNRHALRVCDQPTEVPAHRRSCDGSVPRVVVVQDWGALMYHLFQAQKGTAQRAGNGEDPFQILMETFEGYPL